MTRHTDAKDAQRPDEIQQSIVDYLIFTGSQPHWVEVKSSDDNRLNFKEITHKQNNFMESWVKRGVLCWLFLTLGSGRAPEGRSAWLIAWDYWQEMMKFSIDHGMKSTPWRVAMKGDVQSLETVAHDYQLEWLFGEGWTIPTKHYIYPYIEGLRPLYG
jgi:hypothetical protein